MQFRDHFATLRFFYFSIRDPFLGFGDKLVAAEQHCSRFILRQKNRMPQQHNIATAKKEKAKQSDFAKMGRRRGRRRHFEQISRS